MHSSTSAPSPGPAGLSIAELSAARLDGELYPLAEQYCPVDLPPFPSARAAVLLALRPEHAFAERLSAAWLHGAVEDPPALGQFALPTGVGARPRRSSRLALRQVAISPGELQLLGGCPVTSAARTLVDLLLDDALGDAEALSAASALGARAGLSPAAARSALRRRPPLPNRALAERRLDLLGA
ncbi:hypothetical protein [Microterricola viridarii]|nr:hypothetical protein [Microterricola viridarii]